MVGFVIAFCVFGFVVFTWFVVVACCSVGLLCYLLWGYEGCCWLIMLF